MKLRLKLILAFLLLSVLPLAGMTIYSYRSSCAAFREVVEAEAADMTEEMSTRMEAVTADLSARMQGLNDLPYEALLAQNTDPREGNPTGARFIRTLKDRVGDAAPLIKRLKYTPVPRPGSPRHPPRPGMHPPGDAPPPHRHAGKSSTAQTSWSSMPSWKLRTPKTRNRS